MCHNRKRITFSSFVFCLLLIFVDVVYVSAAAAAASLASPTCKLDANCKHVLSNAACRHFFLFPVFSWLFLLNISVSQIFRLHIKVQSLADDDDIGLGIGFAGDIDRHRKRGRTT